MVPEEHKEYLDLSMILSSGFINNNSTSNMAFNQGLKPLTLQ